jgi:peroxiredoxin family protein
MPDRLSIIVFSGNYDRVHYALAAAAAAAAVNRPVTLFFTMAALRALTRPDSGQPGWAALLADENGQPPLVRDILYAQEGIGGFEELLSACTELGVEFMVCEMGLRAIGLARMDLREDVPVKEGGLVTFLAGASNTGVTLFI